MSQILIETKNLKKYFVTHKGPLHAVDDVSLRINRGETLGVVGESGCGKSTLGRVVLHLLSSTDGRIFFEGKDITSVGRAELRELRKNMQIVFQDPYASLDPRKTVSQTIAEPLIINSECSKADIYKRVSKLMDTVGLASRLVNSYPHELDGGRRQRIGVARALALTPKFIVCDEPVSALDVSIQAQILNLMQDLQEEMGLTYMFITHDLSVVKYISHNILVMYLGQVVETCESKTLFKNRWHPYTQALLSAVPQIDIYNRTPRVLLKGEITSPINPKPGCRFAARCAYAKDVCRTVEPEFTEVASEHFVACHFVKEINQL